MKTKNILTFTEPGPSLDISVHKSGLVKHTLVRAFDDAQDVSTPTSVGLQPQRHFPINYVEMLNLNNK